MRYVFERLRAGLHASLALALFLLFSATPAASSTNITACGTINTAGNYVLTKSLKATGNCLIVTVSNVAIDLHKHSLTGNGTGAGITDDGNNVAFIVIANGKISHFTTGIDLSTETDQTSDLILNVNASGNSGDGVHIAGRDNNLMNVTAGKNGGNGIELGRCCDSLYKVTANENSGNGLSFDSEDYLLNVTSNSNSGNGVSGGFDALVVNSVANKNSGNGLELKGGDDLVISSVANGNQGNGVVENGEDGQVTNTKAGKNQGSGISFEGVSGLATSVTTNKNAGDGVLLTCPGNAVRVSAKSNATNLDEISMASCTNVRNNAP
jgi:hypothetical protein